MNLADRIQNLRKQKGITQEELADKIGVSRQAVSKWESEQSMPDLEKIIIISEYFDVTTDYLLKGIENEETEKKQKPDTIIFSIVATAFNLLGLVLSSIIWYEEQTAQALAVGLILMILGCMIFGIGMVIGENKHKAKRGFWVVNIWILSLIPLSFIYNHLYGYKGAIGAPYPLLVGSILRYGVFWVCYIIICSVVTFFCIKDKVD